MIERLEDKPMTAPTNKPFRQWTEKELYEGTASWPADDNYGQGIRDEIQQRQNRRLLTCTVASTLAAAVSAFFAMVAASLSYLSN